MISLRLVLCIALVPAIIVAENFYLGGCGDFKSMLDEHAATQQGINTLGTFFSAPSVTMYLWDPSPIESNQSCNSIAVTLVNRVGTFTYSINNKAKSYAGTANYTLSPQVRLELIGTLPETILGANNKGQANWYPLYISSSDVIFVACRNVFLGRRETVYVLSNQVYSGLNSTCTADAVNTEINKKVKALASKAGGASNCTA